MFHQLAIFFFTFLFFIVLLLLCFTPCIIKMFNVVLSCGQDTFTQSYFILNQDRGQLEAIRIKDWFIHFPFPSQSVVMSVLYTILSLLFHPPDFFVF